MSSIVMGFCADGVLRNWRRAEEKGAAHPRISQATATPIEGSMFQKVDSLGLTMKTATDSKITKPMKAEAKCISHRLQARLFRHAIPPYR